jgi:hypothetical protein
MTEQAGFGPGPSAYAPEAGLLPFEGFVVPPVQRLAMPVQRLEPAPLRRLFGEPARLAPAQASISSTASVGR